MLRTSAEYVAFLKFLRFLPLNGDKTIPTPIRTLGGTGPFDFSVATNPGINPAAVPITFKSDNGTPVTVNIDVATGYGAVNESAVTVDELFAAIAAETPTNITASKDATTLRIKIALTTPGSVKYLQVYGAAALIAGFGQGYGSLFIKSDTGQSFGVTPTMKESSELSIQDSNGKETSIMTDSYKKGDAIEYVDTALDFSMRALIEGGGWNSTTKKYEDPHSESVKPYFMAEAFYALYNKGENKEADLIGYVQETFRTMSGQLGAATHDYNINPNNITLTATNYTDETGVVHGSKFAEKLTVAAYNALNVTTV